MIGLTFKVQGQHHKLSYGFYAEVIKRNNSLKINADYLNTVENVNRFGFGLGAGIYYKQTESLSFRTLPGLAFEEELLTFQQEEFKRGSVSFKLPVHVLWRFTASNNFRLVTGLTPIVGLAGGRDPNNDLNFKQFDLTGDIGLSYYIDTGKISVRPELKYAQSFIDGKSDGNSIYQSAIDSYHRNKFTLTIVLSGSSGR